MNPARKLRIAGAGALLCVVLLLSGCGSDGVVRGVVVYDGGHRLTSGQVVSGDLVVLAGTAVVERGARLDGSVWVLGGACTVKGSVAGDVTALAGRLTIAEDARVGGGVIRGGSRTQIAPGARIEGGVTQSLGGLAGQSPSTGARLLVGLQLAAVAAVLGLLLGFWWPSALVRVGAAAVEHPAVSLATGALAGITGLVLVVLVGFTLILLPLALLLGLGGALAVAVGWIGLGARLAERLAPKRMPSPVAVALGSLLVVAAVQAVTLVPVVGAVVGLAAASWALGAALLTRFGYRSFRTAVISEPDTGAHPPDGHS